MNFNPIPHGFSEGVGGGRGNIKNVCKNLNRRKFFHFFLTFTNKFSYFPLQVRYFPRFSKKKQIQFCPLYKLQTSLTSGENLFSKQCTPPPLPFPTFLGLCILDIDGNESNILSVHV